VDGGILLDDTAWWWGLVFARATEVWGDDTSTILTSERQMIVKTADGTEAKWIIVQGRFES